MRYLLLTTLRHVDVVSSNNTYKNVFFLICREDAWYSKVKETVNVKFVVKLKKNAMETSNLLREAYWEGGTVT